MAEFKTRYALIKPEFPVEKLLLSFQYDEGVKFAKRQPGYDGIKEFLSPIFPGANFEHVSIITPETRVGDMFVDDMGLLKGLPVNPVATVIYWTNYIRREIAEKNDKKLTQEQLTLEAIKIGISRLEGTSQITGIRGDAILMKDRIWF